MAKLVMLPAPTDEQGKELTAEQIEERSTAPDYVPVSITKNDKTTIYFVAADFDQVTVEIEDELRSLLLKMNAIRNSGPKQRNSKLTNLKEAEDEAEDWTPAQLEELNKLTPLRRKVHIDMAMMAVLGSNVPEMPARDGDDGTELRAWLERGGRTADAVLQALVDKYDPTTATTREAGVIESNGNLISGNDTPAATSAASVAATSKNDSAPSADSPSPSTAAEPESPEATSRSSRGGTQS